MTPTLGTIREVDGAFYWLVDTTPYATNKDGKGMWTLQTQPYGQECICGWTQVKSIEAFDLHGSPATRRRKLRRYFESR